MRQADVAKLLGLFSGDRPDLELMDELARDRREEAARRWCSWWERHPALRGRWEDLAPEGRERIESAPEVWTMLAEAHYGEHDMERWIAAESAGQGWSASGEFRDGERRAPRLATGTIVDWQSPTTFAALPEIQEQACPNSAEQACAALNRIDDAMAILAAAAPHWIELMRRFDAVLLLRNVPSLAGFNSATTRLAMGRPVLRNAHSGSPEMLADALVHETVHTVLDHVELTCPLIADERRFAGATVKSGWTGKQLDLNTFVHACMVWFANFHLWLSAMQVGAIDIERNVKLLTSRSRGFFAGPARQLERFGEALAPGVLQLVAGAEIQVREMLG